MRGYALGLHSGTITPTAAEHAIIAGLAASSRALDVFVPADAGSTPKMDALMSRAVRAGAHEASFLLREHAELADERAIPQRTPRAEPERAEAAPTEAAPAEANPQNALVKAPKDGSAAESSDNSDDDSDDEMDPDSDASDDNSSDSEGELGQNDSDDSDEEKLALPAPKRDKLVITMGERSAWCSWSDRHSRWQICDKMRDALRRRNSSQLKSNGSGMAQQYSGLLKHVLEKGRNNPYSSWETLAMWAHRTTERDVRKHIAKQFCWPNMSKPEVKRWLANVVCGMRVLKIVFPDEQLP